MARDLTMIFSVLVAVFSLGFGVYKNIEANNAKGFAFEQAYRVMGKVTAANIGTTAKTEILDAALGALSTPPPVIDLSRSSASIPPTGQACTDTEKNSCVSLAGQLAELNAACARSGNTADVCAQADQMKSNIDSRQCVTCFIQ